MVHILHIVTEKLERRKKAEKNVRNNFKYVKLSDEGIVCGDSGVPCALNFARECSGMSNASATLSKKESSTNFNQVEANNFHRKNNLPLMTIIWP
jgi:hypothetical protein